MNGNLYMDVGEVRNKVYYYYIIILIKLFYNTPVTGLASE